MSDAEKRIEAAWQKDPILVGLMAGKECSRRMKLYEQALRKIRETCDGNMTGCGTCFTIKKICDEVIVDE